jgi:solute carrier family 25 (adenine nucleotide translocator) protein 4/5/6/31
MNQAQAQPVRNSQGSLGFVINFFSGGLSGIIAKTSTAPIERIKLLLQTQHENKKVLKPYKGIGDCFTRTLKEEGVLAFWRGNNANIIRYFPTQALNFAFKEIYRDFLLPKKSENKTTTSIVLANLMAGGLAGSTSTLFVYPLDMARTRLGVDIGKNPSERQFRGVFDCISQIHRNDGFRGLYKGLGMSLFGIFMYRGLYFGTYDSGKGMVINPETSTFLQKFLFAQACVIFSESISYPTDTIKRKLMLQAANKEALYTGAFDCMRKVMKAEGVKGFFRGNLSNVFRSVGSSLCLVLYDEMKRHSDKYAASY